MDSGIFPPECFEPLNTVPDDVVRQIIEGFDEVKQESEDE